MPNNFAFIDGQNIYLGTEKRGWKLDWRRFRVHLQHSYRVSRAYYFIGYIKENEGLYDGLRRYGYTLIFKQVIYNPAGKPKGNVDAELVLQAMKDINEYEKAILVTSDGDFAVLVEHLKQVGKFGWVISPGRLGCSVLLKKSAGSKIAFMEDAREKIELKSRRGTP